MLDVEDTLKEARFTDDYVDFEFDSSKETAVGIYGAWSTEYIVELGFIVMNLECVAGAQDGANGGTLKRKFPEKLVEDDEKELGIVALGVIAAMILFTFIFVIVIAICCIRLCGKHKSEKGQNL